MIIIRTYKDLNGDSGVIAYEYRDDYIRIRFNTGATYLYTNSSAGVNNINEMKRLADIGNGLNSFINLNVKYKYNRKE